MSKENQKSKIDDKDPQAVNKKIAERLAYFNKLDAKNKGHKDDDEDDDSSDD